MLDFVGGFKHLLSSLPHLLLVLEVFIVDLVEFHLSFESLLLEMVVKVV